MAEFSKIEWTDHTFNPWTGCTNVSPGCDHCYAEAWAKRSGQVRWGNSPRKRTTSAYWRQPARWSENAGAFAFKHGRRQRVFCASLADVFDNQVPEAWRSDLFDCIRESVELDWLLLTKRPQNIRKMLPPDWGCGGYSNVWLGMTAEDQTRFDQRWPYLAEIDAVVRFLSYEPALGPIRLPAVGPHPDWVISGGESGHHARPMDPSWARAILSDCTNLGIAGFHKQWGSYQNNPLVTEGGLSKVEAAIRDPMGKGGGLVDGRLQREFPTPRRVPQHARAA